jgi:DNA-binding Xre family transcriptional regulator
MNKKQQMLLARRRTQITTSALNGFRTTWSIPANYTFTLPLSTTESNPANIVIDWGDGTQTDYSQGMVVTDWTHVYINEGNYQITVNSDNEKMPTWISYLSYPPDLSRIKSIETPFLKMNTTSVDYYFANCMALASIPSDLFRYNPNVTNFGSCFNFCSSLTSIPSDLFRYNPNVTSFILAFSNCSSLASVPSDLFRYNPNVTSFSSCFSNCSSLTSIPSDLFRYNPNVTSFLGCFDYCSKLKISKNIFCDETTEKSTRFFNKRMNFKNLFHRSAYDPSSHDGEAPELWNYDFGTGTPTTDGCFGGAGNNINTLTNYNSIPSEWKN